jgi:hypothetical protein
MTEIDMTIAKKADITIFLAANALYLQDGNDTQGGNVLIKRGKLMSWANRTGTNCTLKFYTMQLADDDCGRVSYWPFGAEDTPDEPGGSVKTILARTTWEPRVRDDLEVYIHVKYDVDLPALPHVPVLDPVIIVKP